MPRNRPRAWRLGAELVWAGVGESTPMGITIPTSGSNPKSFITRWRCLNRFFFFFPHSRLSFGIYETMYVKCVKVSLTYHTNTKYISMYHADGKLYTVYTPKGHLCVGVSGAGEAHLCTPDRSFYILDIIISWFKRNGCKWMEIYTTSKRNAICSHVSEFNF